LLDSLLQEKQFYLNYALLRILGTKNTRWF